MGYKIKNTLLVIPARCGSKGIKFKNIVDLNGKPLIYYTLKIAKKLKKNKLIDSIFISTDCVEIKSICEKYGIKVDSLRVKSLSGDRVKTSEVILSIINSYKIKNINFNNVLLLQPTSPLRSYNQVANALTKFKLSDNNSLISVYKDSTLSDSILYYKSKEILIPKTNLHNLGSMRQEKKDLYVRNGAIYIFKTDYFLLNKSIICKSPGYFEMDKISSINIDEYEDLEIARRLI